MDGNAQEVIDADGALVTPGFVDIHTHYDGQATWDDYFEPSVSHGVTTAVMGNCGVGFAPVRPEGHTALIDIMEGVEDFPGTALSVGMPLGEWGSFPEYLDFLGSRRYAMSIAAQIPHAALRFYVMGERSSNVADEDASPEDISEMARLVREAMDAGAVGFSTSRTIAHKARSTGKFIPGTFAPREELHALAQAMRASGRGVIEAIPAGSIGSVERVSQSEEMPLMEMLSRTSGRPVTFSTFQLFDRPNEWRELLSYSDAANRTGANMRPQVIPRAITFFTSLRTYHMFMLRPSYKKIAHLPLAERVAAMRRSDVKQAILSERNESVNRRGMDEILVAIFELTLRATYPFTDPVEYEPKPEHSVKLEAKRLGKAPQEHMYDLLLNDDGNALFMLLSSNYVSGDLEVCREMMLDPNTVSGNGDSGAHVCFISDCSVTTYPLTHWVKERTRGERLPLELMVSKMTGVNADLYGFDDRGTIAVGKRADINVIDLDRLSIGRPELRYDLPNEEGRLLQPATGYLATMVNGTCIRRDDQDTHERPGRLLRGGR